MITEEFKIHSSNLEKRIRQLLIDYGIDKVDEISHNDIYSFFSVLRHDDENFREFVRQAAREEYHQIMSDPVLHEQLKDRNRIRFARNKLKNTPAYRRFLERQHRYCELRKGDDEYRTKKSEQDKSRYSAVKSDPESYAELLRKNREYRAQRMLDPSYSKQHKMEQAVRYQRRKIRAQFPEMSDEDVDAKAREEYERLRKRKEERHAERKQRDSTRRDVVQNQPDSMSSEEKRNLVQRIAGSMSQEEKRDLIQWITNSMASGNV